MYPLNKIFLVAKSMISI